MPPSRAASRPSRGTIAASAQAAQTAAGLQQQLPLPVSLPMLPPTKTKRPNTGGRLARPDGDSPGADETQWSTQGAPTPSEPTDAQRDPPRTRLLRTVDEKPTAPRLQDLFPRDSASIEKVVTFWDPGSTWPGHALADLHGPGVGEVGSTRLVHGESMRSFALIHHTLVDTRDGQTCAILHVEAQASDAASADVALMLLERSDHAVVLTGGAAEHRDLPRRLQDFCRQAAWRGPQVQFVSPADKPSRADRLRKTSWPRSVRVNVLEAASETNPGWLVALLERVAEDLPLQGLDKPAATAVKVLAPAADDLLRLEPRARNATPAMPAPGSAGVARPDDAACEQALTVASLAPGFTASALIDTHAGSPLALRGDERQAQAGVASALQMWAGYADETLDACRNELVWTVGAMHHIALPVEGQPGLLLLSMVDREFGDVSRARWQLAVARNAFM